MAVSVSNTTYGIIKDAMIDAGLLQEGEDPNSEQLSSYMRRLCDIINLWQTQGLKLFLWEERDVPLIEGQNTYTLNQSVGVVPNKNSRIIQARVETSQGERRPVNLASWEEWNRLPQTSRGTVTTIFEDKRYNSLIMRTWNTPDAQEATNKAVITIQVQAANPYNLEADVMFPQEWRIALRWGLADDIATGQPQAIMDRCQSRANAYRIMLEDWEVEEAQTTFAPDFRGAYRTGDFR